ncbi:hypothetical protein DPMN_127928 [Dreissena polymorpha]|uniref:Uncharacterized protein n=1 Tax=Dreissena polymorpha TaxID=45954 RepID=A0A9D4JWY1_DREPO|nr:hypothetical protein DPMN_127928 [Dreissena polymorpha]
MRDLGKLYLNCPSFVFSKINVYYVNRLNALFSRSQIQCCGVNDYSDFREANVWLRKLFQDGYWFELQTPLTCCNMAVKPVNDFSCAVNPSEGTSYFLKVWSCSKCGT